MNIRLFLHTQTRNSSVSFHYQYMLSSMRYEPGLMLYPRQLLFRLCVRFLAGCRNFLPAHRCEGGVCLDGWDILLPLHAAGERATVAVPDGAITVEVGTHTARVSRVIRDLNATAVVLRAAEATDAPPLCVVLPEGVRVAEEDTLSFSLLADRCRLWEE